MYLDEKEWKPVEKYIPDVIDNAYYVSIHGEICDGKKTYKPDYPSSNGYNYAIFMTKSGVYKIFQMDMLMVFAFDLVGEEFIGKHIRVKHIDNDTRNDDISNLCVVEDIEEWKMINEPNVKPNTYEISSRGNIRHHGKNGILKTRIVFGYEYISLMCSDNTSRNHTKANRAGFCNIDQRRGRGRHAVEPIVADVRNPTVLCRPESRYATGRFLHLRD